jgi:hypothetical protein
MFLFGRYVRSVTKEKMTTFHGGFEAPPKMEGFGFSSPDPTTRSSQVT